MKKEIYAKKKFGQNFLIDQNIIKKIIEVSQPKNKNIIEIGPGRGALTKILVKEANKLVCFEIDPDMVAILKKEIDEDNFELNQIDFLNANLEEYKGYDVIANIPYYITTDILFKIFDYVKNFNSAILMVQKEVAQRIIAQKNSPDYSKLSLTCQYLAECKLEFIVKSNSFSPAPKVDSAIISLKFKKNIKNYQELKEFFKLCFIARRKKMSYSLLNKYSLDTINKAYSELKIDSSIRVQQLDLESLIKLYESLEKFNN
ncbi:16S rRNA (adenine(1518)-N(6)/adenine(1519)-N(6))-dimethyltransferase [Mycoplasmopsis anatis]|uniref:16S rRNA (adenine(1518)-N(6)/adenine(1519)-N(6))- dimethyltransferase RsmA n=1 Tax=Mycoplasmopsis anatis TaxID=171279 RepID=UPI000DC7160A|nr:16S rRNA (adenine(1518)-N(6)/adenine(1519)-N(6))-dimethyltransferase RsmA [Mycoplasmopsis anatis]AWX70210.1 16S rRNA (adenine(1518)-N(6)/adenine(1519)-N(6))-dimethyltransferase [Mycoplasmopsis anatis]VEU74148.1 dimethyladenosine transferase rRNA modification enzyme [Mycoplasmopsis anatis]